MYQGNRYEIMAPNYFYASLEEGESLKHNEDKIVFRICMNNQDNFNIQYTIEYDDENIVSKSDKDHNVYLANYYSNAVIHALNVYNIVYDYTKDELNSYIRYLFNSPLHVANLRTQ